MTITLRSNRLTLLVVLGMAALASIEAANAAAALAQNPPDIRACPYEWQELQPYSQVVTQRDPLSLRATPGGRIIGAVPQGWAVIVLESSPDGQWTRISNQYGTIWNYTFEYPDQETAWVATRYLEYLGEFCEKPISMVQTPLVAAAQAQQYTANEDWLQLGDRIALAQP